MASLSPAQRSGPSNDTSTAPALVVPPVIYSAFNFMLAIDSRQEHDAILAKAYTLLHHAREVIAAPDATFTTLMLNYCMEVRVAEIKKRITKEQVEERKPDQFPPEMWQALSLFGHSQRYCSPFGRLERDEPGQRAFQRDYLRFFDTVIAEVERDRDISDKNMRVLNQVAGNVVFLYAEQFIKPCIKKSLPASELTKLLQLTGPLDVTMFKLCASVLSATENISLKTACKSILSRLKEARVGPSPELENDLTEWSKTEKLSDLSELSRESSHQTLLRLRGAARQLLATDVGSTIELRWMNSVQTAQKNLEYLRDPNEARSASTDVVSPVPPEYKRFARLVRATMADLNEIGRAAHLLEKEGLTGLSVEIDHSPFLWPRVAEVLLATKPRKVILNSPLLSEPYQPAEIADVKPHLFTREAHHLPIALTIHPKAIVEYDTHLATSAPIEWSTPQSGFATIQEREVVFSLNDEFRVMKFVAERLGQTRASSPAFLIRALNASPSDLPLAFGTLFTTHLREVPGYSLHSFGRIVQIFLLNKTEGKEPEQSNSATISSPQLPPAQDASPPPPTAAPKDQYLLVPDVLKITELSSSPTTSELPTQSVPGELAARSIEAAETLTRSSTPADPEAPTPTSPPRISPQPSPITAKVVKREAPPTPPRDPRPRISQDQALIAKTALASIPEIQAAAKASPALTPLVPFTPPEISSTLHILKNGEKPGNKALKALRAYVAEDSNFKDAVRSQSIRLVRANLEKLTTELLG